METLSYAKIEKILFHMKYRVNAQACIEKLVKPYTTVIDPIWKSPKSNGIPGELAMNKSLENNWEKEKWSCYIFTWGAYYLIIVVKIFVNYQKHLKLKF